MSTTRRVKSGATGAADGSTWADAYTTLSAANSASSSGDIIWVSDAHSETSSGNITFTDGVTVLCVSESGASGAGGLSTGAVVGNTAATFQIGGTVYVYGTTFFAGNNTTGSIDLICSSVNSGKKTFYENCRFELRTTSSGRGIRFNNTNSWSQFTDCVFQFRNTGQFFDPQSSSRSELFNCSLDVTHAVPADLCRLGGGTNSYCDVDFVGCDFGNIGANDLVLAGSGQGFIRFIGCELPDSWSGAVISGGASSLSDSSTVEVFGSAGGAASYTYERHMPAGSVVADTGVYVTTGVYDGVQRLSYRFSPNATPISSVTPASRLVGPWMTVWNTTTGSSVTASVEIVYDSSTDLNDDQVWLEYQFLGTTSESLATITTERPGALTSGSAQSAATSASWTGTGGFANENKNKLQVSFTPQHVGLIAVRVVTAFSSTTLANLYVDPNVSIA